MTILECKKQFKKELANLYSETESGKLFSIFLYEQVGFNNIQQRRFAHQELLISDYEDLLEILEKLKSGKPYQQILGHTEFYGKKFWINQHVLIPRPETEELIELAISEIQNSTFKNTSFTILDIGTGSGVIPIILKKKFPKAIVSALDVSADALQIAQKNADYLNAEIHFKQIDYLNTNLTDSYDVIISNPPYIGIDEHIEIENSVKEFEPNIALFSPTSDALIFYRKIAKDAEKLLNKNGRVFMEINQKLGPETLELFRNFSESKLIKDLSGNDRFIIGIK